MTVDEAVARASAEIDRLLIERWDRIWLQMMQDGCSADGAEAILDEQKTIDRAVKDQYLAGLPDQLIAAFRSRD